MHSLVNETAGQVLYVCPTNQLIEQGRIRAEECGLEVASYYEGNWSNEEAFSGAYGPCLTNYAAVFNGKSIFRKRLKGITRRLYRRCAREYAESWKAARAWKALP